MNKITSIYYSVPSFLRKGLMLVCIFGILGAFIHFKSCNSVYAACGATETRKAQEGEEIAKNYFVYTSNAAKDAHKNGKVVLYFWAPWCSSCTSLDEELREGKVQVPDGVTLLRVDYTKESDLKYKYQVVTQHTFVQIDHQGNLLSAWVGGDIDEFTEHLK